MIFYYSSTGNTQWMAQSLSQDLHEELYSIADCWKEQRFSFTLKEGEMLGFCFPTHAWNVPPQVKAFLERLDMEPMSVSYCFMATTCGDETGLLRDACARLLGKKGITLDFSFSLIMPESYVLLPGFYLDTHSRTVEKVSTARREIKQFEEILLRREKGLDFCQKGSMPWFKTHILGWFFTHLLMTDKPFKLDKSRCSRCGLCAKLCPKDNITLFDGQPVWKKCGECTTCLSCYHHCPAKAIEWGPFTSKKGQYRFKYGS